MLHKPCTPIEIWAPIEESKGYYEVSNTGKVRSMLRSVTYKDGRKNRVWPSVEIKQCLSVSGYLMVDLKMNGHRIKRQVHRLVAIAFIDNKCRKKQVNHKDGNKQNNCSGNLEWVSQSENVRHAFDNGHHSGKGGTHYKAAMVKNIDTGVVYGSISEAAAALNTYSTRIIRLLRGQKTGPRIEYV